MWTPSFNTDRDGPLYLRLFAFYISNSTLKHSLISTTSFFNLQVAYVTPKKTIHDVYTLHSLWIEIRSIPKISQTSEKQLL